MHKKLFVSPLFLWAGRLRMEMLAIENEFPLFSRLHSSKNVSDLSRREKMNETHKISWRSLVHSNEAKLFRQKNWSYLKQKGETKINFFYFKNLSCFGLDCLYADPENSFSVLQNNGIRAVSIGTRRLSHRKEIRGCHIFILGKCTHCQSTKAFFPHKSTKQKCMHFKKRNYACN